jgi:hypothetical protein
VKVNIVVGAPGPANQQTKTDRKAKSARVTGVESEKPFQPGLEIPNNSVERNHRGQELEREGLIDNAIECYRANVKEGFGGNYPYDRLAVIYRRRKDRASEVAVLERAVEVFDSLLEGSPRSDVQTKLARFRERLHKARQSGGERAQD